MSELSFWKRAAVRSALRSYEKVNPPFDHRELSLENNNHVNHVFNHYQTKPKNRVQTAVRRAVAAEAAAFVSALRPASAYGITDENLGGCSHAMKEVCEWNPGYFPQTDLQVALTTTPAELAAVVAIGVGTYAALWKWSKFKDAAITPENLQNYGQHLVDTGRKS